VKFGEIALERFAEKPFLLVKIFYAPTLQHQHVRIRKQTPNEPEFPSKKKSEKKITPSAQIQGFIRMRQ
jgi:hypothetical protein